MSVIAKEKPRAFDSTAGPGPRRSHRLVRKIPLGYLVPAVVILLAFAAYPIFVLVRMAFSDVGPSNIVGVWNWVGFANFGTVFGLPEFWRGLARTAGLAAALLAVNLIVGFLVASVLSTTGRITNVVLGIMVFVWALPPIVSGSVWKFLLDDSGAVNTILHSVGLHPVSWLSSPGLALWTVAAVVAWAGIPFSALILRGGLLAITPEVIEAAAIDGAGYWRTQFAVVLPLLRPTMWILGILTVLYAFKSFDFFYVLTQGGPGTATNTLPVLSYYTAFSNFDMSTGATIAVISMLAVALFAIPYVRSIRQEPEE
ncbi:ABC transporter permease [Frondihabitans sucicola]|uniref:ABC transporter permease n=1 Tax=Frondihabitans sucicola TaxID=1268041 RepID=A0ABM8GJF9_9MICO|nr:sugar ABC transporter permease [Frondihabitans sucicola]BDZ48529.1 ABC transporter permease [Frondihabitans sucicola]